jgi:hypothetical protein
MVTLVTVVHFWNAQPPILVTLSGGGDAGHGGVPIAEYGNTNALIEGLNSRIQELIKKAYGYRNKERLKNAIFFHLGDLNLYPSTKSSS